MLVSEQRISLFSIIIFNIYPVTMDELALLSFTLWCRTTTVSLPRTRQLILSINTKAFFFCFFFTSEKFCFERFAYIARCAIYLMPSFFASTSKINKRHILTTKMSASSSKICVKRNEVFGFRIGKRLKGTTWSTHHLDIIKNRLRCAASK